MPYIQDRDRERLEPNLNNPRPKKPGELNYVLTMIVLRYVEDRGLSYTTINEVVGVLTAARDEFYRRVAVPYENRKIEENGDVLSPYLKGLLYG